MNAPARPLGVLKPLGGGDPIPLIKDEVLLGRRPTCDVRLDFENVSGKHCQLRYVNGVWHVRDLGSTNGTTLNGHKVENDHSVMPDDELTIASHVYAIDYDPAVAPGTLINANQFLDEDHAETHRPRSLLELAGLEASDHEAPRTAQPKPALSPTERARRQRTREPEPIEDELSPNLSSDALGANDDDFFDMIKDDVDQEEDNRKGKLR